MRRLRQSSTVGSSCGVNPERTAIRPEPSFAFDAAPQQAETERVNRKEEDRAVEQIIVRLEKKFPNEPPTSIEKTVHAQQLALARNPLRDYIPVLIEHAVKDRLRRAALHVTAAA